MKKSHKGLKILIAIVLVLALFLAVVNIIPPAKVMEYNPFIRQEGQQVMLAAHRGGSLSNPENTLKAYKAAIADYRVDIIESDLWLTKDGHLVYSHDGTIDRTSDVGVLTGETDVKHQIADYTLEELQNFNFGYNFCAADGSYPYRDIEGLDGENRRQVLKDNDLCILEVGELFEYFYETNPELLFIVEIKNGGEAGYQAADIMDELLTNEYPNYKNRLVLGTFHDEVQQYLESNHPTLLTGASTGAAASFVITQYLGVNLFDSGKFACLQIPTSYTLKGITLTLDRKTLIDRAHRRNIAVQYWTINDEEEMRELIELGCDCIMTDDPALLRSVLDSYNS